MKKLLIVSALLSVLLSVFVVNAGLFDRLFSTKRNVTISQAEVTNFTAHVVKKRYLNKSKIKPEDLLRAALDALEDRYPEIIFTWKKKQKNMQNIDVQIYNSHYTATVVRLRDIYDVVVVLRQVYGYIEKNYTPPEGTEMIEVEYTAINGFLEKLDPHSYAFTPKEFNDFTSSTEGNFGGLGIVISMNDDGEIVVVSPIDGTPAMRAGLEAGDAIVQINDESAINMTLAQAVERMRGKPDTKITIRIRREGEPDLLTFHLVRAIIKIQSVIGAMPAKNVGYVKLTGFNDNTYSQLLEKVKEFKKKKMKGLILDLRNNPGGLLSQAIKISDLFLKKGVIVSTVSDDEREVSNAESDRDDILNIPIIVMVNEGSASAAEIVTAALQSNNRATVIGRKTFGKGSVQNLFRMPGGGGLKITIAQYLTPGDISIQSVGVVPEIELAPAFIDAKRVSVFKTNGDPLLEKDLAEHITSKYSPKKPRKSVLTIRYYKPFKDREQLIKERRERPVGRFAPDEEIDIAVKLLQKSIKKKTTVMKVSQTVRNIAWDSIVKQLNKRGIKWHKLVSAKNIDPKKIKITLLKGSPLAAGKENKLLFKAEYPGKVENLVAVLDTEIAYLGNLEVLFGSFDKSVEREVTVTLPDSMRWQDTDVMLNIGTNDIVPVLTTQALHMAILPKKKPEVSFSYRIVEKSGNINGVLEQNEEVAVTVDVVNNGKGEITKGRLLLINTNNNKNVFIEQGSEAVVLKPGEKTTKTFMVKIGKQDKKEPVILAVSLYDYKIRYSAGFTLSFSKKGDNSCVYKKFAQPKSGVVVKGSSLFASAVSRSPLAEVVADGVVTFDGSCGDRTRTAAGYWTTSVASSTSVKNPPELKRFYPVNMPKVIFDNHPITIKKDPINISFEAKADTLLDVMIFVNSEKVYYKSFKHTQQKSFKATVPVEFEDIYNTIKIVARDKDKQRVTTKVKTVYFPDLPE